MSRAATTPNRHPARRVAPSGICVADEDLAYDLGPGRAVQAVRRQSIP